MIKHRPHGIEHPYAVSPDQRVPVLPLAGEPVLLGVVAPEADRVVCEWGTLELPLSATSAAAADAAALAGGEGHLSEAQAKSLGADGAWSVQTPPLAEPVKYRFHAHRGGAAESTEWFEVSPAVWTADGVGEVRGGGERVRGVEWLVSSQGVHRGRFRLQLQDGDRLVGFGERYDALDQRGRELDAVVFEQYKAQGVHGRTYLPMPFAHVVGADGNGWGFHVRTSRRTWYSSAGNELTVEVALGDEPVVDLAIYEGDPATVLTGFLDEVGRAEELPGWVFRLWASGNEWNTQQLVTARMDTHRDLAIPVGAVVIEAWSDEQGITIWRDAVYAVTEDGSAHRAEDFSYRPDGAWPDPKAMIDELHARGIKVILWQIPLQKTEFSTGQVAADAAAMVRDGHAVLEADGTAYRNRGWWFPQALMPDLSVQRTRDWWTEKRRYLVEHFDVDGFKTDGGEHAWGHDLVYADGRKGDEGNNLYPVHYARAFGDLLRSAGKAPVTFSRAGFTGSQAHGIFWAGDEDSTWQAFRSSVTAGLTAASCGIVYWGWDLAGFSGPVPDAELYLRAAAASAFMPIMQYHSEFNHHQLPLRDRTPWHVAETTGDDRVVPLFRRFATLRESLVPYLTEQAARTIATDRPLMRPLFFDHENDPEIWNHPYQYLLGDELLINPVLEPGATTWTTYLPAGEWIDVWTGDRVPSGLVTRDVPLEVVPVYCRASRWSELQPVFS
ncbi:glycoside hydrolase family 31 [Kribbella flavida DSM 17836]|uniref:1,3-alpha-isomaltosidase n=1 Tax=Kribbella flavida (strain DSM 17836 / JCM 10339 / NBRC 14399) TaxID=479435 RepID=AIMA_KRIFD|nr:TIM-barrel domain-containing protein [Kribbella flavida]D2PPM7.1 RecName: Full=1,3-alpha-isomaltosidase [Kribbella flavida DSM 17836]ADB30989.1 glycoside hydrolase family 31 [Kribbella flavida DSM 17836]